MGQVSLTLNGKRWSVRRPSRIIHDGEEVRGLYCEANRAISVRKDLTGVDELATFLHEMIHAIDDRLDEYFVEQESLELSVALDKLGYRRLSPAQIKSLELD